MRRSAKSVSVCAAATAAALFASHLSAAEIQWKGGTDVFAANNWTVDGLNTQTPGSSDFLNVGAGGTVSSVNGFSGGRLRVGHNFTRYINADGSLGADSDYEGSGTVNAGTGSPAGTLSFGGNGASGTYAGNRAGLTVGFNADGTFNHISGITSVTQNVVIGADDPGDAFTGTGTGKLNVLGGSFRVLRNDMLVGFGNRGEVVVGPGGNMNIIPTNVTHAENPDLYVGFTTASTLSKVGDGTLNIANSFFIGSGSTVNLLSGPTLTKAKTNSPTVTYTVQAPDGHMVVGRSGSANDILNIDYNNVGAKPTTVGVGGRFLLASGGGGATNSTVNQTKGDVTIGLNLVVSDTGSASSAVYNLNGGTLVANAELSRVGRRGDGKMFQTAGTATFNAALAIGDDASTAAGETDNATGLYKISGGTLTANLASGDALRVGSAGTGTLRVVGDDGIIDVNGGMLVGNTSDGTGNLAYQFETDDLLSQIDVSGTATIASGSGLSLDSSLASPTQRFYNLLTAADVIDNGMNDLSAGWAHGVVAGGNGEILQAGQLVNLYWDTNGAAAGAGGATPSGAWDGSAANFTTDATGNSATSAATMYADDVVFTAGGEGTGAFNVAVTGTQTAHAVKIAQGNVTLSGGTLAVGIYDVSAGASGTVSSSIAGDAGGRVTKT